MIATVVRRVLLVVVVVVVVVSVITRKGSVADPFPRETDDASADFTRFQLEMGERDL